MSAKLFSIFFLVLVVGSFARSNPVSEPRKCVPGKYFYDGCNNCSCDENGEMFCTLKSCQTYDSETGTFIPAKSLPAPKDFWE